MVLRWCHTHTAGEIARVIKCLKNNKATAEETVMAVADVLAPWLEQIRVRETEFIHADRLENSTPAANLQKLQRRFIEVPDIKR